MINHTNAEAATGKRRRAGKLKGLGVAMTAGAFMVMSALPAWAAENMTITFIRHGESTANAENRADTSVPGPVLTATGSQQAIDVAARLGDNNYDGIYASNMVRTQLTAAPMSQNLGLPINVLPGVREIEAGKFENGTERGTNTLNYIAYPLAWSGLMLTGFGASGPIWGAYDPSVVLPPIPGLNQPVQDLTAPIPGGTDVTGKIQPNGPTAAEFDGRVDGALQQIYDNGDRNAVVFSHGGTMMFWTLMNANNLTVQQKIDLFANHPMDNTGSIVIEGNPTDGWRLVSWDGAGDKQQISESKGPIEQVLTQVRTLSRQLGSVVQDVAAAFQTGDIGQMLNAINRGAADALFSTSKFVRAINAQIISGVTGAIDNLKQMLTPPAAPAPAGAQTPAPNSGAAVSPASFAAPVAAKAPAPAAAQAGDSPAKVGDVPASGNKVDAQVKADDAKANADEKKADAKVNADEKQAEGQTKADDAKAGADAAKADGQAKADDAKAKAAEKKAAAEAKKAEAKAKADEKKAEAKAKADEKKADAKESAHAGAGAGTTD